MGFHTSEASASERSDKAVVVEGQGEIVEIPTKGLGRFSLEVLRERARLALEDPAGEVEAVAPLSYEQATYNYIAADVELRSRRTSSVDTTSHYLGDLSVALHLPLRQHKGMIQCPAHEDRNASLSWQWSDRGFLLLNCHAGCTFDEIRAAVL